MKKVKPKRVNGWAVVNPKGGIDSAHGVMFVFVGKNAKRLSINEAKNRFGTQHVMEVTVAPKG